MSRVTKVMSESITYLRQKYYNLYPLPCREKNVVKMFLKYRYLIYHTSEKLADHFHMPSKFAL